MLLSTVNKNNIIKAIKKTAYQYWQYKDCGKKLDCEKYLLEKLKLIFYLETVRGSNSFHPNDISPDILIEGICVGEVKRARRGNLSSEDKNQIVGYVEHFELPGFFVLFDPDEVYPVVARVRWYFLYNGSAFKEDLEWKKIEDYDSYNEEEKLNIDLNYKFYLANNLVPESKFLGESQTILAKSSQREMMLSLENKSNIIKAIKITAYQYWQQRNWGSQLDCEKYLLEKLKNIFCRKTVRGSNSFNPSDISPDILIEGICVGEVQSARRGTVNSENRYRIADYVKHFELPGFFVLFDPNEVYPVVAKVWWCFLYNGSVYKENHGWKKIEDYDSYNEIEKSKIDHNYISYLISNFDSEFSYMSLTRIKLEKSSQREYTSNFENNIVPGSRLRYIGESRKNFPKSSQREYTSNFANNFVPESGYTGESQTILGKSSQRDQSYYETSPAYEICERLLHAAVFGLLLVALLFQLLCIITNRGSY